MYLCWRDSTKRIYVKSAWSWWFHLAPSWSHILYGRWQTNSSLSDQHPNQFRLEFFHDLIFFHILVKVLFTGESYWLLWFPFGNRKCSQYNFKQRDLHVQVHSLWSWIITSEDPNVSSFDPSLILFNVLFGSLLLAVINLSTAKGNLVPP